MARAFCIPGVIFLVCALVLNFLASISLPYLRVFDVVRVHYGTNGAVPSGQTGITELRLGVWAPCYYNEDGDHTCRRTGHGYGLEINNEDGTETAFVKASWTRGLAVHPVATAATFLALLFSLSSHVTITLVASLMSFLGALLTLIAFAIDIALYVLVRNEMKELNVGANTNTAPAFWMTLVALVLLLLAGCTVCFGRRKDRLSDTTQTYPSYAEKGIFSRFRR